MNYYSIKELESYSGIKAHTIRMWEKRYDLLHPTRTDTNIRLYSDEQLLKLLNTVTLIESGWKISKVSKLSKQELIENMNECFEISGQDNYQIPINTLISKMFDFDEAGFEKIVESCFQKIGVYQTMIEVVYPFLHRVGMMWRLEELSPAQEHFASAIIRQKLIGAINALPIPEQQDASVLLFLPEDEFHELGLLMSKFLLKKRRINTYYLGCNTPIASVQTTVEQVNPSVVMTFLITKKPLDQIEIYLKDIINRFDNQEIWVAAHMSVLSLLSKDLDLVTFGSIDSFLNLIEESQIFGSK